MRADDIADGAVDQRPQEECSERLRAMGFRLIPFSLLRGRGLPTARHTTIASNETNTRRLLQLGIQNTTFLFCGIGQRFPKSPIYCSNVEQYLFEYQVFDGFAANIKKLPTNDQSLFIRTLSSRGRHPARVNGHMFTTLMQRVAVFLKDYSAGEYTYYQKLVNTNYIAAEQK
jgi:hypothetical protein